MQYLIYNLLENISKAREFLFIGKVELHKFFYILLSTNILLIFEPVCLFSLNCAHPFGKVSKVSSS